MRAPALDPPVIAPNGMLRLTPEQMEGLRADMVAALRLRVADYLKDNIPPGGSSINAGFFHNVALHSEPSAKALGIGSWDGHIEALKYLQRGLRNSLQDASKNNCGSYGDAWTSATEAAPTEPAPR